MTHGQVEMGGQPKGPCLLCFLIRETRLVFQPGHNLLVLQQSLLVLAFLEWEGGSGIQHRSSGIRWSYLADTSGPMGIRESCPPLAHPPPPPQARPASSDILSEDCRCHLSTPCQKMTSAIGGPWLLAYLEVHSAPLFHYGALFQLLL